jgi:hypothetical protein
MFPKDVREVFAWFQMPICVVVLDSLFLVESLAASLWSRFFPGFFGGVLERFAGSVRNLSAKTLGRM